MGACTKSNGLSPKIQSEIKAKLGKINAIFNGVLKYLLILNEKHEPVFTWQLPANTNTSSLGYSNVNPSAQQFLTTTLTKEEMANVVQYFENFRGYAPKFLQSFKGCSDSTIQSMHLKGSHTIFSYYDKKEIGVAFYCVVRPELIEEVDTQKADSDMQVVLDELKQIMMNVVSPSSKNSK